MKEISPGLLLSCLVLFACGMRLGAQRPSDYLVYIGSYTNTTSKGIYVSDFDSTSGVLSPPRLVAEAAFPAQLWVAPNGRYMFSSNQDTENIVVLRIDHATGRLTPTGVERPLANPGSVAFVEK